VADPPPLVGGIDGEEPEEDVLVPRMAAVLDGGRTKAAHDRRRSGQQKARRVCEERPRGRRVAPRREGGGDPDEPLLPHGPVDRPAPAVHHP
jgi:hypothetical protein